MVTDVGLDGVFMGCLAEEEKTITDKEYGTLDSAVGGLSQQMGKSGSELAIGIFSGREKSPDKCGKYRKIDNQKPRPK